MIKLTKNIKYISVLNMTDIDDDVTEHLRPERWERGNYQFC